MIGWDCEWLLGYVRPIASKNIANHFAISVGLSVGPQWQKPVVFSASIAALESLSEDFHAGLPERDRFPTFPALEAPGYCQTPLRGESSCLRSAAFRRARLLHPGDLQHRLDPEV